MKRFLLATPAVIFLVCVLVDPASAQNVYGLDPDPNEVLGEGWSGFMNLPFLRDATLSFVLATVLGAAFAHHPRTRIAVDMVEEAEAPKTFITYAVVGALIGLMVLQYGLVVGFVVFGIGGLTRFRTTLPSTTKTGRLIDVTLVGLAAGLNLPAIAILATAFGYGLIFVLENRITFSMAIKGLKDDVVVESSKAHRGLLEERGYRIISEKRRLSKGSVSFVFQASPKTTTDGIQEAVSSTIPRHLRGTIDWEVA